MQLPALNDGRQAAASPRQRSRCAKRRAPARSGGRRVRLRSAALPGIRRLRRKHEAVSAASEARRTRRRRDRPTRRSCSASARWRFRRRGPTSGSVRTRTAICRRPAATPRPQAVSLSRAMARGARRGEVRPADRLRAGAAADPRADRRRPGSAAGCRARRCSPRSCSCSRRPDSRRQRRVRARTTARSG